jgi:hypothetical protein
LRTAVLGADYPILTVLVIYYLVVEYPCRQYQQRILRLIEHTTTSTSKSKGRENVISHPGYIRKTGEFERDVMNDLFVGKEHRDQKGM